MVAPISAFDFDVVKSVVKKMAATASNDPVELRQLAKAVTVNFCPDEVYSDEMIDALVNAALAASNEPDAAPG